jgi:SnoaL-like domain
VPRANERRAPMKHSAIEVASPGVIAAIDRWHLIMGSRGPEVAEALDALLDDDVVLYSPVVFTPQRGKAIVAKYLTAAKATFAAVGFGAASGPSFRYVKHIASGNTAVLEFETQMNEKYVNGVDIISVNDAGRITEFRVMVRPLQALHSVHELMGAELGRMDPIPTDRG